MEQIFSRRGFLKGAAAAALAVSAMGLTGCSTDAGAEPSTAVILGDYKVDLDLKRSVLGKNGDGSATVKLSVFVTNNDAGAAAMPFSSAVSFKPLALPTISPPSQPPSRPTAATASVAAPTLFKNPRRVSSIFGSSLSNLFDRFGQRAKIQGIHSRLA